MEHSYVLKKNKKNFSFVFTHVSLYNILYKYTVSLLVFCWMLYTNNNNKYVLFVS